MALKKMLLAALAVMFVGTLAHAQAPNPRAAAEAAVKYRQSAYTVLGSNFGRLGGMVSGRAPFDAKQAQTFAERVAFMATIVPEAFPANSGPDSGVATKAKAELWANQADFQKLIKDMQDKTAALSTAAKSGDLDTIKAPFGAAAASCKACHDKYKLD